MEERLHRQEKREARPCPLYAKPVIHAGLSQLRPSWLCQQAWSSPARNGRGHSSREIIKKQGEGQLSLLEVTSMEAASQRFFWL